MQGDTWNAREAPPPLRLSDGLRQRERNQPSQSQGQHRKPQKQPAAASEERRGQARERPNSVIPQAQTPARRCEASRRVRANEENSDRLEDRTTKSRPPLPLSFSPPLSFKCERSALLWR
ncbi:MAG: hypothetical protein MUD14_28725 [Hydrococcus sp. Prado102]|nr:hypothetical protein [Hydrococcus sp. Prado102]